MSDVFIIVFFPLSSTVEQCCDTSCDAVDCSATSKRPFASCSLTLGCTDAVCCMPPQGPTCPRANCTSFECGLLADSGETGDCPGGQCSAQFCCNTACPGDTCQLPTYTNATNGFCTPESGCTNSTCCTKQSLCGDSVDCGELTPKDPFTVCSSTGCLPSTWYVALI